MSKYVALALCVSCVPLVRPPAPPDLGPLPSITTLDESDITVPIRFDISGAVASANAQLPTGFSYFPSSGYDCRGRDSGPPNDSHCWQRLRNSPDVEVRYLSDRTPLSGYALGDHLFVSTTLGYAVRARVRIGDAIAWENASCGCNNEAWCNHDAGARRSMTIGLTSTLAITPTWRLSSAFANGLSVTANNQCELNFGLLAGFAHALVTQPIVDQVRGSLSPVMADLDRRIASATAVRDSAKTAWEALQTPIPISLGGAPAILSLRPSSIAISPLSGDGASGVIRVQVRARPVVEVNAAPVDRTDLPNAVPFDSSLEGFDITLPVSASIDDIAMQLRKTFVGRKYPPPPDDGVSIENIDLYGYGSDMVLRVAVKGKFDGVLYLRGRLMYDASRREVMLTNIGYTLETDNILIRTVAWWNKAALLAAFARSTKWAIGSSIDASRAALTKALNRQIGATKLVGTVERLDLTQLASDSTEVRAVFTARGHLSVDALRAQIQ